MVPGEAFGTPGYLRLSYALGDDDLVEGVGRIQKLLGRGCRLTAPTGAAATRRSVTALPKAHLHLHFTGAMRHTTLLELAAEHGVRLPDALRRRHGRRELTATDERGWFRFQRLYDAARSVLRTRTTYAGWCARSPRTSAPTAPAGWRSRSTPAGTPRGSAASPPSLELVLDAVRGRVRAPPASGSAVIIGANRTRHPLDARTLARLAVQYAGRGVVGFGLANDERRAPRRGLRAGLPDRPHGPACWPRRTAASCSAPASVRSCVDGAGRGPDRPRGSRGRGPAPCSTCWPSAASPARCAPSSNVALGVYPDLPSVPLRPLLAAGVPVALGADDPLLFGSRLAAQYTVAREAHGLDDAALAELARSSVRARTDARRPAPADAGRGRRLAGRRLQRAADQHRLGGQLDPVGRANPGADLPGQGEQVGGGRPTGIGERQGVLAGDPGRRRGRSPGRSPRARSARPPRS